MKLMPKKRPGFTHRRRQTTPVKRIATIIGQLTKNNWRKLINKPQIFSKAIKLNLLQFSRQLQ